MSREPELLALLMNHQQCSTMTTKVMICIHVIAYGGTGRSFEQLVGAIDIGAGIYVGDKRAGRKGKW